MILFIILIAVVMLLLLILIISNEDFLGGLGQVIVGFLSFLLIFGIVGCYSVKNEDEPKAIDVYRGNTTLQITYQDSIPIDSTVVFKNK